MTTGIYIGSTAPKAGKSLFSFSLGILLQQKGLSVGYMKPLGSCSKKVDGVTGDTDALIIQELLGQNAAPDILSPVMLPSSLHELTLHTWTSSKTPLDTIAEAYAQIKNNKDITLVSGTKNFPSTGSFCGIDGLALTRHLHLRTILVERFCEECDWDSLLYLAGQLGSSLLGVVLNDVPEHALRDINTQLVPYLQSKGIAVHGIIPHDGHLSAIRITELAHGLEGYIVTASSKASQMVEGFLIGTMQVDNFMMRLRSCQGSAVIVGGDRADLQLAALHCNCPCIVLTGNFTPSELVRSRAEKMGIPLIVVKEDTYTVARNMSRTLKAKKLRDLQQIRQGMELVQGSLNLEDLCQAIKK